MSASMWELVSPMDALEEEPAAAGNDPFADPFEDRPADPLGDADPLRGRFDDLPEDIRPAPAPPHRLFGDRPLRAVPAPDPAPLPEPAAPAAAELPGAGLRRSGRVKTRLLGFEHSTGHTTDIFDRPPTTQSVRGAQFPVGWIVVVDGPGRGASMALLTGVSQIGRDDDQAIQLDFGDTAVSRKNHAAIAYDEETRSFFVGHGGKSNLVRLNGKPLLSTEPMKDGDTLTIGETRLRLVALCGERFSWSDPGVAEPAGP
ncbi:MAG: FHA domain-containing protein [Rhodobacteraceae bacterium]|nr:FHA domain-containing protein [Paracoccaceae bacterium]